MSREVSSFRLIVVIVNFELPQVTLDCIQSILNSEIDSTDILLVDNGSRDDSVEIISRTYPQVTLLSLPENLGFVGGYNAGISQALALGATHIVLLNNDTIIDPSTIRELVKSRWDVAIPKILYYDQPQTIWAAGASWRSFPPSVYVIGHQRKDSPIYNQPRMLDYATACAILVSRAVLQSVGGFDPVFETNMEDFDWCYRVRQAGYQIGYVPSARIFHKDALTQKKFPKRGRRYLGRNLVLFYRKDQRFPTWMLYIYMIWVLFRETLKGNIIHLPDYIQGYADGFTWIRHKSTERK